jgi:hypothetical protein
MNQLIKGTIAACQEQGIKTATPDEIAHMQALWETKYNKNYHEQNEENAL